MTRRALLVLYVPLRVLGSILWGASAIVHSGTEALRQYIDPEARVRRYEVSHEWTVEVGRELARIAVMTVDNVANEKQLFQLVLAGSRALRDLAATSIGGPLKERVYSHIAEGFLRELNGTVLSLPSQDPSGERG